MSTILSIRKAKPTDARRISYLIHQNTEKVVENQYSPEQVAIWKKANSPSAILRSMETKTLFCAFAGQYLVGTIGLLGTEVVGLYVSPARRKQGIGGQLLTFLENYAQQKGIKELTLTATPSGEPFYQAKGYEALKPVVVNILGVDFLETAMKKRIPSSR